MVHVCCSNSSLFYPRKTMVGSSGCTKSALRVVSATARGKTFLFHGMMGELGGGPSFYDLIFSL